MTKANDKLLRRAVPIVVVAMLSIGAAACGSSGGTGKTGTVTPGNQKAPTTTSAPPATSAPTNTGGAGF